MKSDLYNLRQGSFIVVSRATSTGATNSSHVRAALAWNLSSSIKNEITFKLSSNIKLKSVIFIVDASVVCKYIFFLVCFIVNISF